MKKYFIHINNQQQGPFSLEELKNIGITGETPVWYEGLADWMKAGNSEELQSLFKSEPPPIKIETKIETVVREKQEKSYVTPRGEKAKPVTKNYTSVILIFAGIVLLAIIDASIAGYQRTHPKYDSEVEKIRMETQKLADSLANVEQMSSLFFPVSLQEQDSAIHFLTSGSRYQQDTVIQQVTNNPNRYTPPVLFSLSDELYSRNRKKESYYWYYLAVLRTSYDVNRSNDSNAFKVYDKLTDKYSKKIAISANKNPDSLRTIIERVVRYENSNQENYDPRWINFYGKDSATIDSLTYDTSVELSKSFSEWADIKIRTLGMFNAKYDVLLRNRKKTEERDTTR